MLLLQQITIVIKIERHIYVLKDNTFIQSQASPVFPYPGLSEIFLTKKNLTNNNLLSTTRALFLSNNYCNS